jgi:hypothetical protein
MNGIEHVRRHISMMWLTTLIAFAIALCGQASTALAQATNTFPSSGNVGVGTASPGTLLDVQKDQNAATQIRVRNDTSGTTAAAQVVTSYGNFTQYGAIGTFSPTYSAYGLLLPNSSAIFASGNSAGLRVATLDATNLTFGTNNTANMTVISGGNVGIGTTTPSAKLDVNGNINITGTLTATGAITGGTINATYQDVAEWVPATHAFPAGTVVVLNPNESNQVMASGKSYDTGVAGVVSERPGLALGEAGKDKVLVATTGRVKVKVDATRAPIHVGDLLVTSDVEGVAMKSQPLDLGGTPIHRPGTLIGKALEPLEKGAGEILVLLSLQ